MYPENYHYDDGNIREVNSPEGPSVQIQQAPAPAPAPSSQPAPTTSKAEADWASALASGVPEDWAKDFLQRNPNDYHRIAEAYLIPTSQRSYDSQTSNPTEQAANQRADSLFFGGQSPWDWFARQQGQQTQNAISASQSFNPWNASRNTFNYGAPPLQFDDPYTKRLEDIINQQLSALEQPQSNPAMDQLLEFLNKQFQTLSTAPGYSPEDLALLRTQFLEPIERDRAAGRQRVLERTAARGMLPSSGLHEQDLQEMVDRPSEERRIAAQRDLAIDAINRRRQDLDRALNLGQVGAVQIPGLQRDEDRQRRTEALQLASILYDLPNRALQENLAVINGAPGPESLFNQAVQLQNVRNQQQAINQQKWAQIGALLAGLDF